MHLTADINTKQSTTAFMDLSVEKIRIAKQLEFGNINADVEAYKRLLTISPYHLPLHMKANRPISDILLTVDSDWPLKYHSRKLIAKIRDASASDPMYAFYQEFSPQMYSEEQKRAHLYSFLINALLFNV